METQNRFEHIERNPKTHAEHRKESFWQITLPLIIGILIILAAVGAIIFSAVQPVTDVRRWADVSLIWMILPSLVFAFFVLVILVGLVYAVSLLLRHIPHFTMTIQIYFEVGRHKVSQISNKIVEPILKINSAAAALRYIRTRNKHLIE